MIHTAKCLKGSPPKKQDPRADAICTYMKALDDQCKEIIEKEAANGDPWAVKLLGELSAEAN